MSTPLPPQTLIPWDRSEAISVDEAAHAAMKSPGTIRAWARERHIGRRVGGGTWMISHPALMMLLNDDKAALAAYLGGEREAPPVRGYFERLRIIPPK